MRGFGQKLTHSPSSMKLSHACQTHYYSLCSEVQNLMNNKEQVAQLLLRKHEMLVYTGHETLQRHS